MRRSRFQRLQASQEVSQAILEHLHVIGELERAACLVDGFHHVFEFSGHILISFLRYNGQRRQRNRCKSWQQRCGSRQPDLDAHHPHDRDERLHLIAE